MAKYRKKPIVIEAVQWNGLNLEEIKQYVCKDLIYSFLGEGLYEICFHKRKWMLSEMYRIW